MHPLQRWDDRDQRRRFTNHGKFHITRTPEPAEPAHYYLGPRQDVVAQALTFEANAFFASMSGMYMHRGTLRVTLTRRLHLRFAQNFRPLRIARFSTSIRMSPTNQLEITNPHLANVHLSVDPEGKQVIDLNFTSEALGMPAADGYGWAQLEFGDQIGEDDRYTIVRKLGWGSHSSTWLARDSTSVYYQLLHY